MIYQIREDFMDLDLNLQEYLVHATLAPITTSKGLLKIFPFEIDPLYNL